MRSTHQVLGGAEPLQPVQGQEVSRVLVRELGGLLQTPLLVQDGFIPDGELAFLRLAHGLRLHRSLFLSLLNVFVRVQR